LQQLRRRLGDDHDADLRQVVVEGAGQLQRRVLGQVGADRDDVGDRSGQVRQEPRRVVDQAVAPVAQGAVETAVERGAHPRFELDVGGREHELTHRSPFLRS
jgi:hypothetical protein